MTSVLNVAAGGLVSGHDVDLGRFGLNSSSTVDAATLTVRNTLTVGLAGTGEATIQGGGLATVASNAFVGQATSGSGPSFGTLRVTGANSQLAVQGAGKRS